MRIVRLTLRDFRGYRGEYEFEFDGENALVAGGNGSGKSSVLEAVEFLFDGNVHRLVGERTQGISTKQHIPHRRADPANVFVEATFRTSEGEVITARREFTGNGLEIEPADPPAEFEQMKYLVSHNLHKLTRADMVDLVVARPKTRRDQFDNLLNLEGIDPRRRQLKRLKRKFDRSADQFDDQIEAARGSLRGALDIDELSDEEILESINKRRRQLGGTALRTLPHRENPDFRNDLTGPEARDLSAFQRSDVESWISTHRDWFDGEEASVREDVQNLVETVRALDSDENRIDLDLDLLERGSTLVDGDTDACPLCGVSWESDELQSRIEARQSRLDRIQRRRENLRDVADRLDRRLQQWIRRNDRLLATLGDEINSDQRKSLKSYGGILEDLQHGIESCREGDTADVSSLLELLSTLPSEGAERSVEALHDRVTDSPGRDDVQSAWEELGIAERRLAEISESTRNRDRKQRAARQLEAVRTQLVDARDEVLDELFERVERCFEEYYTHINPDETGLDAALESTKTGLKLRVGFYGDGEHPPHAMHSEGHQDLMGICLFLAMVRELSGLSESFILLDDVVMSVDGDHRKEIADLFESEVDQRFQFLFTTHDEAWDYELSGLTDVVSPKYVFDVEDWTFEEGPSVTRR